MHPLIYLSYGGISSVSTFVLENQNGIYFVLVLILLALVLFLCCCILWLGKTRRENELAQQQHAVSAFSEERRLHFESQQSKNE
jgi:uncharacterized membrane protein